MSQINVNINIYPQKIEEKAESPTSGPFYINPEITLDYSILEKYGE